MRYPKGRDRRIRVPIVAAALVEDYGTKSVEEGETKALARLLAGMSRAASSSFRDKCSHIEHRGRLELDCIMPQG